MAAESQETQVIERRETRPILTLDDLPHEIILYVAEILLQKPRRNNGSGVCNWIRTSIRYAEILIPKLYTNAFFPLRPFTSSYSGKTYTEPGVSTPPHRMWRSALNWQSEYVLGYFSTLDLAWIKKVRFFVELGRGARLTTSGYDEVELMIHKVTMSGNVRLAQILLAKGVSPNDGRPLLKAVRAGHFDVVRVLLDADAEIFYRERAHEELLHVPLCAAISLHSRTEKGKYIAPLLIERIRSGGGSFEYLGGGGFSPTPLYHALMQSSIDVVRLLLDYGADPFTALNPAASGHTPCHHHHKEGDGVEQEISLLLFNKMAERDHTRFMGLQDNFGNTPLHNAIIFQEWSLVCRCIEFGFDVSGVKNKDDENALHLAIRHDAPKRIIDLLLAKGPKLWDEAENTRFQDLFWFLVENNRFQGLTTLAGLLNTHKITFNPLERRLGRNALYTLCTTSKINDANRKVPRTIQLLLDLGVSPDLQDMEYKRTPLLALLHRKSTRPLPDVIRLLVEEMSEPALAAQDFEQNTCLHLACRHAEVSTATLLLSKLNPESILLTKYRETALCNLLEPLKSKNLGEECSEILRLFIQRNPEIVHTRDQNGNTPLHMFTLWTNNIQDIKNLHKAGADLSALNKDGEPPFHMNSSARMPEVTHLLLDNGADMHEKCGACRKDLADFIAHGSLACPCLACTYKNAPVTDATASLDIGMI